MPRPRFLPALLLGLSAACSGSDALGPASALPDHAPALATRSLPAKKYTLLLGNSLSFGYQPNKDVFDPTSFTRGFGTLFVQRLNAIRQHSRVTEINLACPGETTETFVAGGCYYRDLFDLPLHTLYRGSQLDAAEDFLRTHRGQVNPIILSLAANELYRPYLLDCNGDEACVSARIPGAIQAMTDNYEVILSRLRALEPNATLLILVEYRFPRFPRSFNDGLAALYQRVRAAGRAYGATLVESNPIIGTDPCALLFICEAERDIHPTDAGYRALADALWNASGFGHPPSDRP
jgi:lysophospholipase L1-like esterase